MIIRINKLHVLALAVIAVFVSFFFALRAEQKSEAVISQSRSLPVVMYHHVTQNSRRAGKYVVLQSELESDFDYIKKCGYTCVTVSDLIEYANGKKDLPEKIVMITFDDGFESTYELAWPLLKERNMKAVVSPVGTVTQTYTDNGDKNVNYAYMTWSELSELDKSDEFEVQNHSYDMHYSEKGKRKGLSRMSGESEDAYRDALTNDLGTMQKLLKKNSGIEATAAVYPFGVYSSSTLEIVKELDFQCSMTCEERINSISSSDPNSLFELGRFNRPSSVGTKQFFEKLGIKE
ncbi:MAG: polysaccharide deacetylase family protein [Acutalibacteraceae bacterium]